MYPYLINRSRAGLGAAVALGLIAGATGSADAASSFDFKMVRTKGLPKECAEHATASVHIDIARLR